MTSINVRTNMPAVTGIKFRTPSGVSRYKYDSRIGDFALTANPTIRATLINGQFGVYSGGFRPTLSSSRINLNEVISTHGTIQNYMVSLGLQKEGETSKVVGVFFAGGPSPSANAVFRGIVVGAHYRGMKVVAFEDGCEGVLSGSAAFLTPENVWGIHRDGDVYIGTSRKNPKVEERERIRQNLEDWGISGLIAIGGDDTQTTAKRLSEMGIPVVGVPKTIDNDLPETDVTFGHDTVVDRAAEEMANIINDSRAGNAWHIGQVMGRKSGSWTIRSGLAAGVTRTIIGEEYTKQGIIELIKAARKEPSISGILKDILKVIMIDGQKFETVKALYLALRDIKDESLITIDLDEIARQIADLIQRRKEHGTKYGFVAIAEGLIEKLYIEVLERDSEGKPTKGRVVSLDRVIEYDTHGNPRFKDIKLAEELVKKVKELTGANVIDDYLGYQFRSADPSAADINLSSRLGMKAIDLMHSGDAGRMVRISGEDVSSVPFSQIPINPLTDHIIPRVVRLDSDLYVTAKQFERYKER